jgi:hypothetical protein
MECPILKQLETERAVRWDGWAYFYSTGNRTRHWTKQTKEAKTKYDEVTDKVTMHRRICGMCKE